MKLASILALHLIVCAFLSGCETTTSKDDAGNLVTTKKPMTPQQLSEYRAWALQMVADYKTFKKLDQ